MSGSPPPAPPMPLSPSQSRSPPPSRPTPSPAASPSAAAATVDDDDDTTRSESLSTSTSNSTILPPPPPPSSQSQNNENEEHQQQPQQKPRLLISKMHLENFKSYAGPCSIGPFHKSFTSVVGPNGSGKSNVIDAMLFVFGKKASKLRLKKVSELIHCSDKYKGNGRELQYASVTVFFHDIIDTGPNDTDYTIIPNSSISVTRIAYIDNKSIYKLNNKTVQFKDIAAYLGGKGIDLDNNRFLILQGEVEMISMMNPKGKDKDDTGLLEYLEDIIGSHIYVEQAEVVGNKVEELGEVRQAQLMRVKAVEKEKDALVGSKKEAEGLMKVEKECRGRKNVLFQIQVEEGKREVEGVRGKIEGCRKKLEEERLSSKESTDKLADIEDTLQNENKMYEQLNVDLKSSKDTFNVHEKNDIKFREDVKHLKASVLKFDDKSSKETAKALKFATAGDDAEASLPNLEANVVNAETDKTEHDQTLEDIYTDMKAETSTLRLKLETQTSLLAPLLQERAVFQSELDTGLTEIKLLEDNSSRARVQLDKSEVELNGLDGQKVKIESEIQATQDLIESKTSRVKEAESEEKGEEENEKVLTKEYARLTSKYEEVKATLALNANNNGNAGKTNPTTTALMKASKKGGELEHAKILGRLGDLASINSKYDVAVSTACGMLDHIVVETTEGAQLCLKYLRKHGLGRANFIPVDKMKKSSHDTPIQTPENSTRLYELITPSTPSLSSVLFLAVGQTLVAEDMETATRWAYDFGKRWRVVTVDGNLIETSGTMAGGGGSVRRGGMKVAGKNGAGVSKMKAGGSDIDNGGVLSVNDNTKEKELTPEDVKTHETLATTALETLKTCKNKRRALSSEIYELHKAIKTLTLKQPKLKLQLEGCEITRVELNRILPDLRDACVISVDDVEMLKQLNGKVEKCKSDMASCAMQASKLEGEVAKLKKSILDAGGPRLKSQIKTCDDAGKNVGKANTELNTAKVTLTSSRKNHIKSQQAADSAKVEGQGERKRLEDVVVSLKRLEEEAFGVMQVYEEWKVRTLEKAKLIEGILKDVEAHKKNVSKVRTFEIEVMGKLEDYGKQVVEGEGLVGFWEGEIEKLHVQAEGDEAFDLSDDEDEDDEGEENGENDGKEKEGDNEKEGDKDEEPEVVEKEEDELDENGDLIPKQPKLPTNEASSCSLQSKDVDNKQEKKKMKKRKTISKNLPTLPPTVLTQYSKNELKAEIAALERELEQLSKHANMSAILAYRKKEADYLSRVSELDKVTMERNSKREEWDGLRKMRLDKFMDGFNVITLKLKEMYQMITLGGDAELELVDSLDPFSEGIVFSVRPPKKSWKNIANLSGGEKTLSSLALVFALHHYKPTPLYVMDEIDAALDFKNVSIVANYIKQRTKDAQFVIISLRNNMFELADRLVGIYKTDNCTKSVTINPKSFVSSGGGGGGVVEEGVGGDGVLRDRTNVIG